MKLNLTLLATASLFALSVSSAAAQAQTGDTTTVLTAERLFDARTGRMIQSPVVLIRGERIVSVQSRGSIPAGAAKVVNLRGMTLMPGLIDMHTHIDSDPSYGGYNSLQFSDRFWSVIAVPNAMRTLQAGFTTIRNVGSDAWNDVGLGQAINEGKIPGPRIVPAGYAFGATGGHCDSTFFPPSMNQKSPYNADSPEAGRRSVREIRKYGAQVIKICATGGVFSRNTEPGQQQMSLSDMKAIVDDAHMYGLKVAAHAHGANGIKDAIRAGVDTIEHASLIDDEGIELARKYGAYLSMDIYNTEYTQSEGKKNGVLEDNMRKDREVADAQREGFRKAHKAGVKMVYGTDAGVHPNGENGKQFRWMVKYGMTPAQAIQSATAISAEALGRKDIGLLEAGRFADIIAVKGDPSQDITLLENVDFVMKGGEVYKGGN